MKFHIKLSNLNLNQIVCAKLMSLSDWFVHCSPKFSEGFISHYLVLILFVSSIPRFYFRIVLLVRNLSSLFLSSIIKINFLELNSNWDRKYVEHSQLDLAIRLCSCYSCYHFFLGLFYFVGDWLLGLLKNEPLHQNEFLHAGHVLYGDKV